MKKSIILLVAIMLFGSIFVVNVMESVQGAGVADTPWPMFHGNVRHTGLSLYDTAGNHGNLRWTYRTSDKIFSSAAIGTDGSIYFGSEDYFLYALDSSGSQRWRHRTGDHIKSSPAVATDGTIYFGSEDHYLYALNPDGSQRWRYATFGAIDSSPAIAADGTVYIGSKDGRLYAVNPDGTVKWNYNTGNQIVYSSPAIAQDGTVYIGSYHSLYAINPDSSLKWEYNTGNSVDFSSPAIANDGTVYIACSDALVALNPDGSLRWEYDLSVDTFVSSPAIASDGTLYAGSLSGYLYAINPDGGLKWRYDAGGAVYSSAAIGSDGTIYTGSNDGGLYALNPDGTLKWKYNTGSDVRASPAIGSDGTIYVGSYNNYLYVIGNEVKPSPPRNLKVSSYGPDYVNITWDPPLDNGGSPITSYKIYRGTASGQETYYTYVGANTLYFLDNSPISGETNYYYVTALSSGGESDASNEVSVLLPSTTRPSPPQNLIATAGDGYIDLSWSAPVNDGGSQITNYTIYRGTESGGEVLLKVVSSSVFAYRDTAVDKGYTYYYYVSATNGIGESDHGNEVSAAPKSSGTGGNAPSDSTGLLILGILILIAIVLALLFILKKKGSGQVQSAGYPQQEYQPPQPVQGQPEVQQEPPQIQSQQEPQQETENIEQDTP